tara:strand:+ start:430 stop:969 length:540 start_codon:yes stop_codon:yes gene_type:complete
LTVKVKLDNLSNRIKKAVRGMRSDKFTQKLTDMTMKPVQDDAFRYKTGKKFRRLSKGTIRNRKQIAKYNTTHPKYELTKPNLTITGRFLRSFKFKIGSRGNSILFKLDARGTHAPYRRADKKQAGTKKNFFGQETKPKPVPNKVIRKRMAEIGRDPIEFSKKYTKLIMDIVKEELQSRL